MAEKNVTDTFSKLLKNTTKQMKKLRDTVQKLKEENQKDENGEKNVAAPKQEQHEEVVVSFSMLSVAKATILIITLVVLANFLGHIADIILVFFIAVLFSAALDPTVDSLEKYKIPRPLSVLVMILGLLVVLGFFISQLIPLVASQITELALSLTDIVNKLSNGETDFLFGETIQSWFNSMMQHVDQQLIVDQLKNGMDALSSQLQSVAGNTFTAVKAIFNGIFNFVLVLILTFFLTVDEKGVDEFFISLFPSKHGQYIVTKMEKVRNKVGDWLRGQIIMIFLMGSLTLIGLLVLGVDYALTLAMMAGIAELLPVVGPILAGIPAVLVAFNESPWLAVWVLGLILFLQQLEGHVLIPLVMKKAVGLSPIIVILAMLVGYETLGILGMIIAIPVTTAVSIFVMDYTAKKK
jgi:predicted PurR-regulated permease PerM